MAEPTLGPRLGFDKYTWGALVQPALFALLPLFVVIAIWLVQTWTVLSGLVSLAATCGAVVLLAEFSRYLGRSAERRMGDSVGPPHTARLLSHADKTLPSGSKQHCHDYFRRHDFWIPTEAEERADPAAARDAYLTALAWFREKTRRDAHKTLLLDENIAYGRRRSLLGLKPLALFLLLASVALDLYFTFRNGTVTGGPFETGLVVAALCLVAAYGWLFIIRRPFLVDASENYALRLLAQCEVPSPVPAPVPPVQPGQDEKEEDDSKTGEGV